MKKGEPMTDLKSMTIRELEVFFTETLHQPKYRAKQVFDWLHGKLCDDVASMTNLPKDLREQLEAGTVLLDAGKITVQESSDGTRKYLFALHDGERVESVYLPHDYGKSVCISSQAGCRQGCRFCASTLDGLSRNLSASEMLSQVYRIKKDIGERIDHVVVMGMGEPLDNYDNLLRFLSLITDPAGQNLSMRNITVSTCGIVPGIRRLADEGLQLTLALSLHAATQEKREALMPVAHKYPLDEVMEACRYYFDRTGRRVTFEYSLIAGKNDSEKDAGELAALLSGMNCHVNLIPVNPVKERDCAQPEADTVRRFQNKLEKKGINSTIRRGMGRDIDGACGQLRRRFEE